MGIRIHLTSFICANVGIALLVVGVVTNHWAGRESSRIYIYEGLWTKCINHLHLEKPDGGGTICTPLSDYEDFDYKEFTAVIAMLFIACGFHVITFIVGLILFCKDLIILDKIKAISELCSLVAAIVGLSIYATKYDSSYYGLKWSYALGWGASLCLFAALVFTIINIDRKRRDE